MGRICGAIWRNKRVTRKTSVNSAPPSSTVHIVVLRLNDHHIVRRSAARRLWVKINPCGDVRCTTLLYQASCHELTSPGRHLAVRCQSGQLVAAQVVEHLPAGITAKITSSRSKCWKTRIDHCGAECSTKGFWREGRLGVEPPDARIKSIRARKAAGTCRRPG